MSEATMATLTMVDNWRWVSGVLYFLSRFNIGGNLFL